MTLTFFLLKMRGTLTLFRLNAPPILQIFPNRGSVKTQILRLFTLTSLAQNLSLERSVVCDVIARALVVRKGS